MKLNRLAAAVGILSLLCSSCNSILPEAGPKSITAILGAFDEEVIVLEEQLTQKQEQKIEQIRFVTGNLNGKRVVIATTGIAKVNAAMTTTLLIEHFRPSEVIFTGIAGAINPELAPGDVVIATKTAQHDLGMLTEDGIENEGAVNPIDGKQNPIFFETDPRLLKLAQKAANQTALKTIKTGTEEKTARTIKGVIITGDIFAASIPKRIELRNRLGADAVEMEGAAVAQICYQRSVPCIVIRGISDMADQKALEDLEKYLKIAASNSAAITAKLVELLSSECHTKHGEVARDSQ